MASQDVCNAGTGTAESRAGTRAKSALTGQDGGRWRKIRSSYCLPCVATVQRGRSRVEGCAAARGGAPAGGCGGHGGGRRPRTRAPGAGRRRGRASPRCGHSESTLDRLAIVFAMPSCAVACFIHPRWRRRRAGGDHKTRMVASGHDGGFAHDAPGLGPRSGSRRARLIHPAAGGRARAMGLGVGGPLRVEPARLRHEGRRLPEPDGRASQAADTIDSAARGEPLAHCGGSTMAVPTDEARGPGPGPPPHGEATHQAQRLCSPRRACAWAPTGGHQGG